MLYNNQLLHAIVNNYCMLYNNQLLHVSNSLHTFQNVGDIILLTKHLLLVFACEYIWLWLKFTQLHY